MLVLLLGGREGQAGINGPFWLVIKAMLLGSEEIEGSAELLRGFWASYTSVETPR